jgi:hypothetical protein
MDEIEKLTLNSLETSCSSENYKTEEANLIGDAKDRRSVND